MLAGMIGLGMVGGAIALSGLSSKCSYVVEVNDKWAPMGCKRANWLIQVGSAKFVRMDGNIGVIKYIREAPASPTGTRR